MGGIIRKGRKRGSRRKEQGNKKGGSIEEDRPESLIRSLDELSPLCANCASFQQRSEICKHRHLLMQPTEQPTYVPQVSLRPALSSSLAQQNSWEESWEICKPQEAASSLDGC